MRSRRSLTIAILCVALAAALVLAVGIGAVPVPPISLLKLILHSVGLQSVPLPDPRDVTIILYLRLPRALAAVLVGSTLAACGVVMQGLFRNPMASSEILGVSAGGSLGAVIAITTGLAGLSLLAMPVFTIAGALLSAAAIYLLSTRKGTTSLLYIVIAGMAISSFFNGLTSALLLFAQQYQMSQYIFWTMGGLDGRGWQNIEVSAPVLVVGIVVLSFFTRELNLFTMGEEGAQTLGVAVERTKRILLAVAAVLTGVAISVAGPIGFIGLLVPHFFRLIVGADHRALLPAASLGGAVFLVLCDLVGRSIAPPFEIRVGIITAVLGSPYLLSLIVRTQRRGPRAA
ncbi:MAG TPA: iron ABC transporter permease [Spirochaetia bacterium]|nr:iron ABC transporter permease [Spirochaetia bacterium]